LEFFQSKQPTRFSRVEKLFFVGVESKQS
jgi:hypothetical protein